MLQIWNGFDGFWQNGAVLEPMVNFMVYANHTRYLSVVQNSYRELYSLLEAYGPYPSFDDMGWYGLSYARIHETLNLPEFLESATAIFNWSWKTGWDKNNTCSGGFWFDNLFNSKQTITNVEMLQLGAKLYRLTNNKTFLEKVDKIYNFILNNDVINKTSYLLSGGVNTNCTGDGSEGYTYNSGIFIGALVEMFKIHRNVFYLDLGVKLADAVFLHRTNENGILTEICEPKCNEDAVMFKGIFVRNLRYLMDILQKGQKRDKYQQYLNINAKSTYANNICNDFPISKCNITFQDGPPYYNISGPVFSPDWRGPFTYGAPMQQTSALDLFVSAILPGVKCSGPLCSFDPSYPAPQPMTCGSHPCPKPEVCCEYSPYTSYTCCAGGQKCLNGICT